MDETKATGTDTTTTEVTTDATTEATGIQYICNLCGKTVVPIILDTDKGIRYQCPECKRFFKPLTREEAEKKKGEETPPLAPPEVELTDRVKILLTEYLPRVYGIPRDKTNSRINAILDTLSPSVSTDPLTLHNHIKGFAPNANDQHLESVITKVFSQLEMEGLFPGSESVHQPRYGRRFGVGRRRPSYQDGSYGGYYDEEYEEEPGRRRKSMKIVVDGHEIQTDFDGYMAWQRYLADKAKEKREEEEHRLKMERLEQELKNLAGAGSPKENNVPVEVGGQTVNVPASIAPLYLKGTGEDAEKVRLLREENERLKEESRKRELEDLRGDIQKLSSTVNTIRDQPDFFDQLDRYEDFAKSRGYSKTGKTTVDVLSDFGERVDGTAKMLLAKMPGGEEFKPEVSRTPEERKKKADEIKAKLGKREDILQAEDELIRAAANLG